MSKEAEKKKEKYVEVENRFGQKIKITEKRKKEMKEAKELK